MTVTFRSLLRHFDWSLWFVSCAVFLAMSAAGWWYYEDQKTSIVGNRMAEISAIADLKVQQIMDWQQDRIIDAMVLLTNPYSEREVSALASGRASRKDVKEMEDWLEKARVAYGFHDIILFDSRDPKGRVLAKAGGTAPAVNFYTQAYLGEVMRDKKQLFTDLYRNEAGDMVIESYIPVMDPDSPGTISGIIMVRIDPRRKLFPFIQTWPTPSESFEIILFRREGEAALILNELRHRKDTALSLRVRASSLGLPPGTAAHFQEAAFEDVDYRGVPVVAVLRKVPDSPWFLLAKEDQAEIYRPLKDFQWFMGMMMGMLFLTILAVLVWIWFRRHGEALRAETASPAS
jgi:hypothetical protein